MPAHVTVLDDTAVTLTGDSGETISVTGPLTVYAGDSVTVGGSIFTGTVIVKSGVGFLSSPFTPNQSDALGFWVFLAFALALLTARFRL